MSPFYLDAFPVTNGDFLEFVRANPKWRRSNMKPTLADTNYLKLWAGDLVLGPSVDSNAPVTFVSWYAARAYSTWKGKRLPTTAEWEYAASASATRPDGDNDPEFKRAVLAWYAKPTPACLPRVGAGRPNYFGLHDLHGLVWEWVGDFNRTIMDSGPEREAFCGGAAESATDRSDYPAFMRYGFRSSLPAHYTVHNLGFRCAKDS